MKIFIDTNVWLRFIVIDDEKQYADCQALFESVEVGKIRPYTSAIVLLEVNYVLRSVYNISRSEVLQDLQDILSTRNLTVIEKTDFKAAISLYKKHNVKLANCLIATQISKDLNLVSYDHDFEKLSLKTVSPGEVVKRV